jgi:hypothetical protein
MCFYHNGFNYHHCLLHAYEPEFCLDIFTVPNTVDITVVSSSSVLTAVREIHMLLLVFQSRHLLNKSFI